MKKRLPLELTSELHRRIHKIAKRLGATSSQLARDALARMADEYEAKFREESDRKRREREGIRGERSLTPIQPITKSKLGPRPLGEPELELEAGPDTEAQPTNLYLEHAAKIARAMNAPLEKRLAVEEALRDIKRSAPLTHPSDAEILRELERAVLKLLHERKQQEIVQRLKQEADAELDELLGKPVNATKTATMGDVSEAKATSDDGDSDEE
jgi:predicted transcriptional regulator